MEKQTGKKGKQKYEEKQQDQTTRSIRAQQKESRF